MKKIKNTKELCKFNLLAIKLIVFIFLASILADNTLSLGIAPVYNHINFEPQTTKTYSYTIINNEHKDMKLRISKSGGIAAFIELQNQTVYMSSEENEKKIEIKVNLPKNLDIGEETGKITITEVQLEPNNGNKTFNVLLEVNSKIIIHVTYKNETVFKRKSSWLESYASSIDNLNFKSKFERVKLSLTFWMEIVALLFTLLALVLFINKIKMSKKK